LAEASTPREVRHGGRADQAILGRLWPLPDGRDRRLAAVANVAAEILQTRLVETVREKLGITYSPSASSDLSMDVRGQSHFRVQIETPPDKFDTFRTVVDAQVKELAAQPVSADELQRAQAPVVAQRRKARERNGFWSYWLARHLDDARVKPSVMQSIALTEAVTAADVQSFFRSWLASRQPVEVISRAK
jgi:zinc protease